MSQQQQPLTALLIYNHMTHLFNLTGQRDSEGGCAGRQQERRLCWHAGASGVHQLRYRQGQVQELLDSGEKLGGYAEPNGDQHALPLEKLVSPPFKMAVPPRAASAAASSSSSAAAAAAAAAAASSPPRKARWHLPSGVLQTAKALVVHDKRLFPADALL